MITYRPIDLSTAHRSALNLSTIPTTHTKLTLHYKLIQQATQGIKTHRTVYRPSTDHGSIDHSIDHIKLTLEKLMVDGRWSIWCKFVHYEGGVFLYPVLKFLNFGIIVCEFFLYQITSVGLWSIKFVVGLGRLSPANNNMSTYR